MEGKNMSSSEEIARMKQGKLYQPGDAAILKEQSFGTAL